MEDIKIRKTKVSDIPMVMKLLKTTDFLTEGATHFDNEDYFKESVKHGIFFVAEDSNGEVIGLIHGEKLMCDGAIIWYFVVDEKCRGRGVGMLLLKKFEDFCRKQGIKWVFGSADINKKTMNFYSKEDYEFAGKYIEFSKNL